ncbi:uncharacterized protein EKO05_0011132 [Ascochyta rabiei]|uniref:uncharacterized protein n=1 Tax=Didymella rabiei TaxID=5454 RepID=UPI00220BFC48|nr:uncharacterized protein EKO05_0011132 [Ascochyta rabiei]UPX20922.1 hypothetical protein EKO05_0011132 [Ascochyta rabiei]
MSLANRAYSAGRSITARVRCVGEMSSEPMITLSTDASRSRKIRALTFSPQRINSTHMTGTVPLRNNFERREVQNAPQTVTWFSTLTRTTQEPPYFHTSA